MLFLKLIPLIRGCEKTAFRHYRGRNNPGLNKRLNIFKKEGLKVEDDDAEEFIESSESDFANVGEAYNEHLNQTLAGKHDIRRHIVKEKYFKEYMPNLLTWSEKEQIRHLANSAPDEWTPEKIAESFPVTVPIVKKLLKYPWKPATEQRITRHDASVLRNWRELKEGSLNIPEDLQKHFLKFSNRTIPPLNKDSYKIDITPQNKEMGEFESIVRRCAAKENNDTSNSHNQTRDFASDQEVPKQHRDSKRMTLNELAAKIQTRFDSGNHVNMNDEMIIHSINKTEYENNSLHLNREVELFESSNGDKELTTDLKGNSEKVDKSIMEYPERIRIPKKAYKRNATYKVNDCYYDHDGRFLYRVLGMAKQN